MNSRELIELDSRHVWHPFSRAASDVEPVLVASARGASLTTADGRELLDGISSWWVNLFGHGHPKIVRAIAEQAGRLEQVIFAGMTHEPAIRLAAELADLLPGDLNRVFYSDDGSTAVEVAIKLAWQYWQIAGQPRRGRLLAFDGGYHGDTLGAMSAGASSGFFQAWSEQLLDVEVAPWPHTWESDDDVDGKEAAALRVIDALLDERGSEIAAAIVEPLVQGASGMRMTRPGFLRAVVDGLRDRGILVIFDEVMTGFGRTGRNFACEQIGVAPDLICLSKGLTGGFLPLGATVVSDQVFAAFRDSAPHDLFCHGHSYTANPVACAAALAALELLRLPETVAAWARIFAAHGRGLQELNGPSAGIQRARILGTIAAFDMPVADPGYHSAIGRRLSKWLRESAKAPGIFLRPLGNVVYLMPPYCMTDAQLDHAWSEISRAIQAVAPRPTPV